LLNSQKGEKGAKATQLVFGCGNDELRHFSFPALSRRRPMMLLRQLAVVTFCAVLLLGSSPPAARAADKDPPKKAVAVQGVLMASGDTWIKVWGDKEKEPVTYQFGQGSEKRMRKAMNGIFHATRLQLTYKLDGDKRQLVSIRSLMKKTTGTVTGEVVFNEGGWWIVLKFKSGVRNAYAVKGTPDKDKVKELQKGDVVTVRFSTDSERHRIEAFQKKGTTKK
jgi:hypothetical protein